MSVRRVNGRVIVDNEFEALMLVELVSVLYVKYTLLNWIFPLGSMRLYELSESYIS